MIGLTGGIASGKSTVSARLRELGAFVADADIEARAVTDEPEVLAAIEKRFGSCVINCDGTLNRAALAREAFSSPEGAQALNAITHPAVAARLLRSAREAEQTGWPLAFIDAALLIEAGLHEHCDGVWLVTADLETRIARVMQRDGASREEALLRISRQMSDEEKARFATRIIENDDGIAELTAKVDAAYEAELMRLGRYADEYAEGDQ